jgi:hypothetical protein
MARSPPWRSIPRDKLPDKLAQVVAPDSVTDVNTEIAGIRPRLGSASSEHQAGHPAGAGASRCVHPVRGYKYGSFLSVGQMHFVFGANVPKVRQSGVPSAAVTGMNL